MESISGRGYFYINEWTDSTNYHALIRENRSAHDHIWVTEFRRPLFSADFSRETLSRRVHDLEILFSVTGKPVQVILPLGRIDIIRADRRLAIPVGSLSNYQATNPTLPLETLPVAVDFELRQQVHPQENILWWSRPGMYPLILSTLFLGVPIAVIAFFFVVWLKMPALCLNATPPSFQWPCLGLVGFGAIALSLAIIFLSWSLVRSVRMRSRLLYVITDERVFTLVMGQPNQSSHLIVHTSEDLFFATLKNRGSRGDILFPTRVEVEASFLGVEQINEARRLMARQLHLKGS